ncbi:exosome complex component RRP45-like isoform X2 [Schistocerca gregaria]|uniref:exosome complex component RRP45-like isoform X2 n=1 Tax=Schistocerca gregaria TaxID=7010 RepID=UPI00211E299C|nr:exosome complex component RRP45-like isoform X2 [Schistocerca gregaria]
MKSGVLSSCEKSFVLQALTEGRRLDGRAFNQHRDLKIFFGSDLGCCQVLLGLTRVIAQVSCEVQQPKPTRPEEGLLLVYVELSPMAAPDFEAGRPSDLAVQLSRVLEKCIKDSRAVDLESLCIKSEEKVWALRVDITVLNHEGNLADAASVAALTALGHFQRPDFTAEGGKIIIHSAEEKDTVPITLHHYPVCVSFAVFNNGEHVVADPTELEERVAEAHIVFGMNSYRELCGVHLGGSALADPEMIIQCAIQAAVRASRVVEIIRSALESDAKARTEGADVGFVKSIEKDSLLSLVRENVNICLDATELRTSAVNAVDKLNDFREDMDLDLNNGEVGRTKEEKVIFLGNGTAELVEVKEEKRQNNVKTEVEEVGTGGPSKWEVSSSSSSIEEVSIDSDQSREKDDSPDIEVVKEVSFEERLKIVDSIELSGDSEEEETSVLHADDINEVMEVEKNSRKAVKDEEVEEKETPSRGWYKSKW